jgi:hypothetical protein
MQAIIQAIIVAIISGFFSLAGIWYQNYLRNKSNTHSPGEVLIEQPKKRSSLAIFFTILIATLPWIIWKFLLSSLIEVVYNHMETYAKIMVLYFFIWLVMTIVAIISGWKLKTLFEKIILFVSSAFLVYWTMWMIIVHNLFGLK